MSSTTMGRYTVKAIEEMAALHGGAVKLAGAELGVQSFGIQVLDFPAGFDHYPEHDHAQDGQEEVYVVLRGSAEFEVDGERVVVDPERLLWVGAGARRKLLPRAQDVRILALGCTPGNSYERPQDFQLAGAR
jgi:mannose-6-phosphate isomerase-like protein (cupin superfamily)